jgi:drug/metabolite transporter (DMT)-like permease
MLVVAMMFWGTTFVIVKQTIQTVPVHWFHTLRFLLGALALWLPLFAMGRGSVATRRALAAGTLMGVPLFGIFALQTTGLLTTTASKSAFITATSVLWVPLLTVMVLRKRMDTRAVLAGCIGLGGLYLLLMDRGWGSFRLEGLVIGDVYTLLCALCVAVHLLLTKRFSPQHDTLVLTAVQLTVVAVLSMGFSLAWDEPRRLDYGVGIYVAIAFLGLVTSALNIWILTHMQRYSTPQRTAVIFLVEPLFAASTAWVVLGEALGAVQWIGALLILGGMVILECLPARKADPAAEPPAS